MRIFKPNSGSGGSTFSTLTVTALLVLTGAMITGSLIPSADNTYDVGTPSLRWKAIYASASTTSGTFVSPNFTDGSVLFSASSGTISQDNSNLFYDDSLNHLGIGDNTPDSMLTLRDGLSPTDIIFQISNSTNSAQYLTVSSTSVQALVGSVTSPAYSFLGDTNTGIYNIGADQIGFTANGVLRLTINTSGVTVNSGQLLTPTATPSAPSYTFSGDSSTGFWRESSTSIGVSANDLIISNKNSSPSTNIFEVQNRTTTGGAYSQKYFTQSSTSTAFIGCTGSVSANAVTCNGVVGTITDSTDINASTTRAAITLTNSAIQSTSTVSITPCATPDSGAFVSGAIAPGAGSATLTARNVGLSNQTSDYKLCFQVFNPL